MIFKKFAPSPHLQKYIMCFWLIEDDYKNATDISFPDGCVELVFSVDIKVERTEINNFSRSGHWAEIIGQMTKPYKIAVTGKGKVFGIRFYPHTFKNFFPDNLSSINDLSLDSRLVLGSPIVDQMGDSICNGQIGKGIRAIEKKLLRCLGKHGIDDARFKILEYVTNQIIGTPSPDFAQIARHCQFSHRSLQRLFLENVGISAKHFSKVIRFQQSLRHLIGAQDSFTGISYTLGYFDQAHFIHDFKTFSGITPSQFQLSKHPVNRPFISMETQRFS